VVPTSLPTYLPTREPTFIPTPRPTPTPSLIPTSAPTHAPNFQLFGRRLDQDEDGKQHHDAEDDLGYTFISFDKDVDSSLSSSIYDEKKMKSTTSSSSSGTSNILGSFQRFSQTSSSEHSSKKRHHKRNRKNDRLLATDDTVDDVIWEVNFDVYASTTGSSLPEVLTSELNSESFSDAVTELFDEVAGNATVYLNESGFLISIITRKPTTSPTQLPTPIPTSLPTSQPTPLPTSQPTVVPTPIPTATPFPTSVPTPLPSSLPTIRPSSRPTVGPTPLPTSQPTLTPTSAPTRFMIKIAEKVKHKFPEYIQDVPYDIFLQSIGVPLIVLLIGCFGCFRCLNTPTVLVKPKDENYDESKDEVTLFSTFGGDSSSGGGGGTRQGVDVNSDTFKALHAHQEKQAKLEEIRKRKHNEKEMSLFSWASNFTTQTIVNNTEELRNREIQQKFHKKNKKISLEKEKDGSKGKTQKGKNKRKDKKQKKKGLSSKPLGQSLDFAEGVEVNIDKFLGDYEDEGLKPISPKTQNIKALRRPSGLNGRFSSTGDVELSDLSKPPTGSGGGGGGSSGGSALKSRMSAEERLSMLEKMASEVSQQHNLLTNVLNQTDERTEAKLLALKNNRNKHMNDPNSTRLSFNPQVGVGKSLESKEEISQIEEAIRMNEAEKRKRFLENTKLMSIYQQHKEHEELNEQGDESVQYAKEMIKANRESIKANKLSKEANEKLEKAESNNWGSLFTTSGSNNQSSNSSSDTNSGLGNFWTSVTETFKVPDQVPDISNNNKRIDKDDGSTVL